MNDNGNTQEEKEEGKAATSSQICTSEAGECGKKVKNAEKKARKFSFDEIFKETYANARLRASAKEVARENVSDNPKGSCVAEELGAMSVQSKRSVERNVHHESELEVHSEVTSKIAVDDAVDDFAVPLPPGFTVDKNTQSPEETSQLQLERKNDGDEGDEFDDFGEGIPVVHLIPAACEAILKHGKKPVSALAFDQQGTGFTTGGYDYIVNLFDFQQMDVSLRPSRELIPCESHVINCLSWSSNGERLLIASGHAQIRILDRQGKQFAETVRGDQYLVDLSNTKGHTGSVNACCWHPLNKKEFMSCSDDGTLRIWSLDDFKEITRCINKQRKVIKTKNAGGKKAIPTTCAFSRDGKWLAAGCNDGSIQIWKYGSLYVNTTYLNRTAHKGPVTSVQFSANSEKILSRSLDGTMKLWNLKNFKKPELVVENLLTEYSNTDCGFSPHGELVFTGTAENVEDNTDGSLLFYDASNFELVYRINYPNLSCTKIAWHPKINQILVGLSDGSLRLYYDLTSSIRGALLCVTRPLRRARQKEVVREEMILSPLTLEMFQPRGEEGEEKEVTAWRLKKYLRLQDNKLRPDFRKPADMPMSGPSSGGRVAASGGTLHSYIAKQLGTKRNRDFLADKDVRASILRHAEEAEKHPYYVANAYIKNQPVPIFQDKTTAPEEEEPDSELRSLYKIPKMQ